MNSVRKLAISKCSRNKKTEISRRASKISNSVKKKKYPRGGLFNKKRFEYWEKENRRFLKSLTIEKSIKIFESLTTPEMLEAFRDGIKFFSESDNPICLKLCLKKRRNAVPTKNF